MKNLGLRIGVAAMFLIITLNFGKAYAQDASPHLSMISSNGSVETSGLTYAYFVDEFGVPEKRENAVPNSAVGKFLFEMETRSFDLLVHTLVQNSSDSKELSQALLLARAKNRSLASSRLQNGEVNSMEFTRSRGKLISLALQALNKLD